MEINCFYFGKFGYTFVPWQIEEDIARIKKSGATSITLNILEQDYKAAFENISQVISIIKKVGLKTYFLADGWCNLFQTYSYFPSVWAVQNSDYCLKNSNGESEFNDYGPIADSGVEKTLVFISKKIDECLKKFEFDGMIAEINLNSFKKEKTEYLLINQIEMSVVQKNKSELHWLNNVTKKKNIINNTSSANENKVVLFNHQVFSQKQVESIDAEIEKIIKLNPMMLCYFDYPPNVENPQDAMNRLVKSIQSFS